MLKIMDYPFPFLKSAPEFGHFETSDSFREFSSESHRILFLGELLGVFSLKNCSLMTFQC
eukprot:UN27889